MNKKTRKDSNSISNKSGLISEFLEKSSYIKSNEDKKEFISEMRTSRQFLYIGPEIRDRSFKMFENNQTQLFQSFGSRNDKVSQNQKIKIAKDSPLKQSFLKSQIDDTTYQSLMNEFMGSYLEERLKSQHEKYLSKRSPNTQPNTKFYTNQFQPITSQKNNISFTNDSQSPINNKDSQITFSGSKQSRIVNQMEESRIVKEEYFLLDQLKKSKRQKNMESLLRNQQESVTPKKQQNLIEESYRLQSPSSSKKFSKSKEKSKPKNLSNGKTKIQQIDLSNKIVNKNIFKKPPEKYQISKRNTNQKNFTTIHTRRISLSNDKKFNKVEGQKNSEKQNVHQRQTKQNQQQKQKYLESSSKQQSAKIQQKQALQNINLNKRPSLNKSLNSLKTFHLSSNKAQNLSRIQKINSIKQKSQPQNFVNPNNQEPRKKSIDLKRKEEQSQIIHKQKQRLRTESFSAIKSPNKYVYEYSYKMDQSPIESRQNYSQKITSKQKQIDKKKIDQIQQNHQNQTSFKKDRQMIRQIKKDLTKLIQKISIAKT